MTHPLMEDQMRLEETQRDLSKQRIEEQHRMSAERGDFSNSASGRLLISTLVDTLTNGLSEWFEHVSDGRPGRRCAPLKPLLHSTITPEKCAYLTFNAILDELMKGKGITPATDAKISLAIGNRIHDELRLSHFAEDSKHLLKKWLTEANQRSLTREKTRQKVRQQMRNLEINWEYTGGDGTVWTEDVRQKLGRVILEKTISICPVCEIKLVTKGGKGRKTLRTKIVVPTPSFLEYIDAAKEHLEQFQQAWLPTIVPPVQWSQDNLYGGGYYTDHVPRYPLVKRMTSDYADLLDESDLSPVLNALNAVQDTPWRINPQCLEALVYVYGLDRELAGLPHSDPQPLPPAPDEPNNTEYRTACWRIHDKNRRELTKRIYVSRVIQLAKKFMPYEAFYFPHDLDSRGRAYPKPSHLNPQGPDFVKGLLEFSEGKPLGGPSGVRWLAIHIANCCGQDKAKLGDRERWTYDNEEMILSVAENPLDDLRWCHVDEPFQFLQAAQAWQGYRREGYDYVCHTPIHVDATCSGLQHYSALLLDSVGGRAVNLLDLPDRQDVYGDVAQRATELCKEKLGTDEHNLAQAWLDFGFTRKITKRSVMVVPYAGTFNACMKYTRDAYQERLDGGDPRPWEGDDVPFVVFGARLIWQAISEVVIAATDAMNWIKSSVSAYAKNRDNTYVDWPTPSGFIVRHRKPDLDQWRMDTVLDGSRLQSTFYRPKAHLSPTKMASSTPPSFIHSLDAAHMVMSIDRAASEGMSAFAVVHDSFATHAADMDDFGRCIREAFHSMYAETNPLLNLRDQLQAGLEEQLPDLPEEGDLDIDQVLSSTFFFS